MARIPVSPNPPDPGERRRESLVNASKVAVPVTVAIGAFWVISQFIWGAGSKFSGSEKDIGYLTSKVDALQISLAADMAENKAMLKEDHDALIEQRVKLATLKEYFDAELASKNVTVTVADPKDKK